MYVDSQDNVIEFRSDQLSSKRTSPIYIVLKEPPEALTPGIFAAYMKQAQSKPREGKLAKELSGLFFNCFPILLGWIVVGVTTAAIPLTAGASSVLTVTLAADTIAGAGSCFNSIARTGIEASGHGEVLDVVDQNEWYSLMIDSLDTVGVAGAGAGAIKVLARVQSLKSIGYSYESILKGLTRSERARLTKEVILKNHPDVNNKALKRMILSGRYPRRFENAAFRSDCIRQIKDAVSVAFAVTSSAKSGILSSPYEEKWAEKITKGVAIGEDS